MRLPPQTEEQLAKSDELCSLVKRSIDGFNAMSPDEQRAMREAHAKSLRQSLEMVADDRTACFEELGRTQARIEALEAENKALREDAKRIYWAGAKDMRELLAEKMIAFGKSVHTEALPEFPACVIRVEIREVNDE